MTAKRTGGVRNSRVSGVRGVAFLVVLAIAACRSGSQGAQVELAAGAGVVGPGSTVALAQADSVASAFTPADAEFMSGMIPHHAQAVLMSNMAATRGARADVIRLAERIIVSQRDEIRLMRVWLARHNLPVPDSLATRHVMRMGGMVHEMLMPGMLTDEEMAVLEKARGSAFDRLFLEGMIRHHSGAIEMVNTLFKSPGGAHETTVFRFATDVQADQTSEIIRMRAMLETIPR